MSEKNKAAAAKLAAALCLRLGPQWRPKVWDNIGWHWRAQRGDISVQQETFVSRGQDFLAYLYEPHTVLIRYSARASTPDLAVADVVAQCRADFVQQERQYRAAIRTLGVLGLPPRALRRFKALRDLA